MAKQMTPPERVAALFMGEKPDRVPVNPFVEGYLEWRGRYFWLFGPETPIADQIKAFGAHDVICGNVDPPSFQTKSYKQCLELCRENIEAGKDSPNGFVLAAGCEFPPKAPPINLMAMVDAAEMFGRYE